MGLGVEDLRWMIPVRSGDVLHVEGEVAELIPSPWRRGIYLHTNRYPRPSP
jgi:acyl dehydratase